MKRFWTTVTGLLMLGSFMTFLVTTEAALQDSFWSEAAQGNIAEIAAANAALQRAQNEQVKQFAQQMVTEHTAMGDELRTLATSKSATLPTTLDAKHQADIDKLNGRSGTDFDRDFMRMMVRDHDRMAKLLSREAERNADADIKAFAAKHLPTVQGHLASARTLNESIRGNRNASNSNSRSSNDNANSADNSNADNTGYSNKRPNVNRNANTNTNTNTNTNSNTNRNTNTNANNGNVNR